MEPVNKITTLPLISQNKSSKKSSKAKKRLSAIDIFKLDALKSLEHSDSGSERDCDEINPRTKESPSGGNIRENDKLKESKYSKRANQTNRKNKQATKSTYGGKNTTRVRKNKIKVNNVMRLPERNVEFLENRIQREPTLTTDCIMEVATMVSEVTISDVEKESNKNKSRKKERLAPELSSPDLRRPSSAFRKKSNKEIQVTKAIHKQAHLKPEKSKEEIKDRPLWDLQIYLKKMAECRQNSMGRPKIKPSLYVGSNITRKSEIGKKSMLVGLTSHQEMNQPALPNQGPTLIPTGINNNEKCLSNETPVITKSTLKFEHSITPDIKIIPPSEENEKLYHRREDEPSADALSQLLSKNPSEIPNSAKETWKTYIKLQEQGFPVTLRTLQRALMTPTDQRVLKELFIQSQKEHR